MLIHKGRVRLGRIRAQPINRETSSRNRCVGVAEKTCLRSTCFNSVTFKLIPHLHHRTATFSYPASQQYGKNEGKGKTYTPAY